MRILSARHKGLKRLIEDDDDRGILTALLSAEGIEGLTGPPGWRIQQLTGDRAETWSISVSGNWRITFNIDGGTVTDLNLEDYH